MKQQEKRGYIFTIAFTVIALITMVSYSFAVFFSNAVSDMQAVGQSSLSKEKEDLEGYLLKGMDVLQVTAITAEYMMKQGATSEELEAFLLEESARYMEDIDENFTGIYGLFQGTYLDGIGWVPDEDYNPKEREWYIAAQEAGGSPTIVSPYLDAQTNTVMISVSQLLYDGDSVISLDIVMDEIQNIIEDVPLGDKGYGFIVDREGLVVAHSHVGEKGKNYLEVENKKPLLEKVYKGDHHPFELEIDGEKCTVFTDVVMDDWYVTLVVQNSKLYHEVLQILVQNIIVCLAVISLIVIFCTLNFRKLVWHMKETERSKQAMEQLSETAMRTLARTIDAKDRYTNGHSRRVAGYAMELARRMGKSEEEQKKIYYAGLLHDLGKIHIPDAIINKPSRLTDEEFSVIKLHSVSGYHILKDMKEQPMISQGAKWHHERYDGKGYPNGLEGDNIPEVARIIGVADAYDAMTSNRSYRQALPQEKVRHEIENGMGTQFDPQVAALMLEMIDEDKEYTMRQTSEYRKRILLVDDGIVNQKIVEEILEDNPQYSVHRRSSGEEGVAFVKETKADIILLDVMMQGIDGFETYGQLRKFTDAPVIFLAEDKDIETISKAYEMGVEEYLIKPFMPEALKEILYSILLGDAD